MRYLAGILAALTILALCTAPGRADNYVYHSGHYWLGNAAYDRYYQAPYYSYGVYYPGYYFYKFSHYGQEQLPSPADPNWRNKVLDIASKRDENAAYLKALEALGIPANQAQPGYVGSGVYSQNSVNLGSYGASGSTLYGYSSSALSALYGDPSPNILYQQAARLTERAQDLAGQGNQGFQDLLAKEATGRQNAAQIMARGLAAATALQAAQGQGTSQTQTTTTIQQGTGTQTQTTVTPAPQPPPSPVANQRQAVVTMKCASCHNAVTKKGGLDLTGNLSPDVLALCFERVTHADPSKRMPQKAGGGPGEPLSPQEMRFFAQ